MKKVFEEHYLPIIGTVWFVSLPMVAKDALGSIPGTLATAFATVLAVVIIKKTTEKPLLVKVLALTSSVIIICTLVVLFVKREVPLDSQQRVETK